MAFRIDAQNPWPWLDAFTEDAATFFNGRAQDIAALERCVLASPVTVLFGKSGLGKTSILQAGLFPLLRAQRWLPVAVRLNHSGEGMPALQQVLQRLEAEREGHGLQWLPGAEPPAAGDADEALWLRLHSTPAGLRDGQGSLWRPLFVLDQFEEIFTLGAADAERQRHLFGRLGDLIENRIPAGVAAAIGVDEDLLDRLALDAQPYRVILSLREDYLPDLEAWCDRIPQLGPHRFRLQPMNEAQALEAVQTSGGALVNAATAAQVVAYVAGQQGGAAAAMQVEPALLSLVCAGLNEERQRAGQATIDAANLDEQGGRIIDRFYDQALEGLREPVAAFVEHTLITPDGVRLSYPLQSALKEGGLERAEVDRLIDRRLLRKESLAGGDRIELVHDRVAAVALRRRQRRAAEAQQREREQAQEAARLAAERDAAADGSGPQRRCWRARVCCGCATGWPWR
jgi:hypothetical protein